MERPSVSVQAISASYQQVLQRIEQACQAVSRDPGEVKLVLVTKGHPLETVRAAVAAGVDWFGENYAEEGLAKIQACADLPGLEWHMIGHIQSRKAGLVAEHYQFVHSLDSLKLAERLDRFAAGINRRLPVLLECNVSGEATKFGWAAWDEGRWPELLEPLAQISARPNLEIRGLMTMAPFFDTAEPARPYFQRLRRLQAFLTRELPQACWTELSMGMSGDFEVAVQEGATIVRVGTAILGRRPVAE